MIEVGIGESIESVRRHEAMGPVVFVASEDCLVGSGGWIIRHWPLKDGKEVGQPINTGSVA